MLTVERVVDVNTAVILADTAAAAGVAGVVQFVRCKRYRKFSVLGLREIVACLSRRLSSSRLTRSGK